MKWDVQWASATWAISLSVSGRLYGLGFSLPVRSQVDAQVRSSLASLLRREMVAPNKMLFQIPAMEPKKGLSGADIQQAIEDAEFAKRQLSDKTPRQGLP